jgi:hypothetical protein
MGVGLSSFPSAHRQIHTHVRTYVRDGLSTRDVAREINDHDGMSQFMLHGRVKRPGVTITTSKITIASKGRLGHWAWSRIS